MKSTSMKIKKVSIIVALAGLPLFSIAQNNDNLVENGGFESNTGKAKKLGQIDMATGWKSPTGARADFFLKDSKMPEIGTTNALGTEDPTEGENYAGIMAFSYQNKAPRTYLMAKLKTPMKEGSKYCISFKLSLAEASKYSCNQIGVNVNKKEFGTDQKTAIIDETNVIHPKNKVFNAFFGWDKVCGTYTAKGGEKFITIGNFTSNENTKYETNKKAKDNKFTAVIGAYYYIDDVVVTLIEEGDKCDCNYEDAEQKTVSTTIYQKQITNLDRMTPKDKIEAQGINFAFGKATLTPQANAALDLIAEELKKNPAFTITLTGHSDPSEDELAVKKPMYAEMDKKRLEAVKAYLISKGVDASRIKSQTKGSAEPNAEEFREGDDDDLKMAKNRRVDVKVN